MVFQDPRAHTNPVRRIGDFMTETLRESTSRSFPKPRHRRSTCSGQVGIDDGERRLRQYPHELSGGMLQRVMIATALLTNPRLILADEPTTALDVTIQAEVMAIIDALRKEFGVSLLFITHDLDLAAAVCDRTAVMYAGQLVELQRADAAPRRPLPPLHRGARRRPAQHRQHRAPAGRDPRPAGVGLRGAAGLRVRAALQPRRGSLPEPPAPQFRAVRRRQCPVCAGGGAAGVAEAGAAWLSRCSRSQGLTKKFGDFVAVDDVSFEVEQGQSLAVVGESGSGKTTVARMIVGLETPTAGTIAVAGNDRSAPARKVKLRRDRGREVQIVFQDPYSSLDPRQSAASAIDEVLQLHHPGSEADRSSARRSWATWSGLDDRQMHALPRALSGGQRQRVAIARALAAEPRVLILDESVAALDVSIQAQVLNLLADIRDQTGISYVLISHDLAVVRQLTDQIVVMRRGQIVERGAHRRGARPPPAAVHARCCGQACPGRAGSQPADCARAWAKRTEPQV